MTYNPERVINADFKKKLTDLRETKKEQVVSCVLDSSEYAQMVGYTLALSDILIMYEELWEAHYGKNV